MDLVIIRIMNHISEDLLEEIKGGIMVKEGNKVKNFNLLDF